MNSKLSPRKNAVEPVAKPLRPRRPAPRAKTARNAARPAPARKPRKVATGAKRKVAVATKAKGKFAGREEPRKAALEIPPILFEGDTPPVPPIGVPGQRGAPGPTPPPESLGRVESAELPDAYGTKQLLLVARDPHWLYAHWDLTLEQQQQYNALSADGHLILRVYADAIGVELAAQVHVHPESRHWFVPVKRGGTRYLAELGYYQPDGGWVTISVSGATLTPPEDIATEDAVQFATIPPDVPFKRLLESVKTLVAENVPLVEAIQQLRASRHPELPPTAKWTTKKWTPEQERALAEAVSMDRVRRVWIGSLEITELLRRQVGSPARAFGSISSPFGAEQRQKGFWFNVNAELVVYGATEPDAQVTLAGRRIELRQDGTFSCRFALPDGQYELPVTAVSADGTDGRAAELKFSRQTDYRGDVGKQPQDPALQPPPASKA